jgi:hypothetical protein
MHFLRMGRWVAVLGVLPGQSHVQRHRSLSPPSVLRGRLGGGLAVVRAPSRSAPCPTLPRKYRGRGKYVRTRAIALGVLLIAAMAGAVGRHPAEQSGNLVTNGDFELRAADGEPVGYQLSGDVEYRFLGDPRKDFSSWGVALESGNHAGGEAQGEVSQTVSGIDSAAGRWFRFTFRGLPQERFAVDQDDLYMKVVYLGGDERTNYDSKQESIYPQVLEERRDLTVNGVHHLHGAETWRTYQLDFWLPFPQVKQVRLSVGFGHGAGEGTFNSEFFVDDFNLTRLPVPADAPKPVASSITGSAQAPGKLIPLGGRWFYWPRDEQDPVPALFSAANADRLLYHDAVYSAPFAGNMTAMLRAGEKDLSGNVVTQDRLIADNVTVSFDESSMKIHTHGIPNHPTAKFPADRFSGNPNPNSIGEQDDTYYIPLDPKVSVSHIVTTRNNSNHALPMGPIGIALNGVVFFNPFDMGNQDATDLMDRCCGHPNQDNQYHYHKYPICLNSPWADDGTAHSPLIGFMFDGFPIYGPYEAANVMAKDEHGERALNDFNIHFDPQRGWHYHVTPGMFPYLIGGYWGTEDLRDSHPPRGRGGPGGGGRGGGGFGGPPGGFPPGPPPFGPDGPP